jgi:hypothetical protein
MADLHILILQERGGRLQIAVLLFRRLFSLSALDDNINAWVYINHTDQVDSQPT